MNLSANNVLFLRIPVENSRNNFPLSNPSLPAIPALQIEDLFDSADNNPTHHFSLPFQNLHNPNQTEYTPRTPQEDLDRMHSGLINRRVNRERSPTNLSLVYNSIIASLLRQEPSLNLETIRRSDLDALAARASRGEMLRASLSQTGQANIGREVPFNRSIVEPEGNPERASDLTHSGIDAPNLVEMAAAGVSSSHNVGQGTIFAAKKEATEDSCCCIIQ